MSWQPIDTAPKDGTRVLLYSPDATESYRRDPDDLPIQAPEFVGHFSGSRWWSLSHYDAFRWEPTLWMPLPPPPA